MTTYINQTIARDHVNALIEEAARARLRREFRQQRRAARAERRNAKLVAEGATNTPSPWPSQIGYAGAR